MITGINQYFEEVISQRAIDVSCDIASTSSRYREINRAIMSLECELLKHLPDEAKEKFNEYHDSVLKQASLMYELMYRQGFTDGATLKEWGDMK